jgi:prolyl 4-hydroxylase
MRFDEAPLLWTVEGIYAPAECAAFIEMIESEAPALATNNPLYRNQDRVMKDDPDTAADLFERLRVALPSAIGPFRLVGLNPRLRFYRYGPGQEFAPHMDHWYRPAANRITLYTILVYFNDDFAGGETEFMEQVEEVVTPRPGMAAIFQHKVRHAGRVVTAGRKYAMRTDAIFETPGPIGQVDA